MEQLTPPILQPSGSKNLQRQKWDLKVSTNLDTRLLLVQDPQSTIRCLQDAIEEDHLAIYPAQGPVKCSTVCAVDYNAAGAERYYPINSKYLLQDALKRDGAEVFAYVELKQKKRKRSLGSDAAPDLFSGAPGQKRPRAAAAAASSPSPLPHVQLEGEVRSRSDDLTDGVEGDTETAVLRKGARTRQRRRKLKEKKAAAATQKAVIQGAGGWEHASGSQEIPHPPQPQGGAAKTGAAEHNEGSRKLHEEDERESSEAGARAKAAKNKEARKQLDLEEEGLGGKSGKQKRGRSKAAETTGAGARQVPQKCDGDLAEGSNRAASQQLQPAAADAAEPSPAHSPEQGRRKRRKKDRHGGGAEPLFPGRNDAGDASLQRGMAPQPSNGPGAMAAGTVGRTASDIHHDMLNKMAARGKGWIREGRISSSADERPASKDSRHVTPPGNAQGEGSESSSEEDRDGRTKSGAVAAAAQTDRTASGALNHATGGAPSESSDSSPDSTSDSSSESESDSDDEGALAHQTCSQQPWQQQARVPFSESPSSGAAGSPSNCGPVQTAAQAPSAGHAEPQRTAAAADAPEKPALPSAHAQSSSTSEDDSSGESSSSDDEVGGERGNAGGGAPAPKQEAPEQLLPKQDAQDESDSEGESDLGFKEEADVKDEEEPDDVKSESEEEAGVKQEAGLKQEGYPEGQAEASSKDESSEDDGTSEKEDSEAEEQESEEEQWGDEESAGSDAMGNSEGESDVASPSAAEGEGGSSRSMAAEDNDFDRLNNEATQKVLEKLADMPDAISLLLAAKSARKKARQSNGAAAAEPTRQEAPSTPVPSDARLASLGEALIRQKESQEQPTQSNAAAVTLPGHPDLKPLAEYKGEPDLRSALRAALTPLVNHQQGTNHRSAAQVMRECTKPEWWPLEKWDRNQLDRRWKALEMIYHAIQKQRRSLMGSASSL